MKLWASILFYSSIPVFLIYLYCFSKTFRMLSPEEASRFTSDARLPLWRQVLGLLPIPLVFFVSSLELRAVFAA